MMSAHAGSGPLRDDRDARVNLAVLIDADNAQASVIGGLLAEIAKYGVANVRRIYGDFTSDRMKGWKSQLLKHSIQPVQQFAYTTGKNATDSSLIIDAMDLMYTRRFDGFCLVSSDSDFTRLAQRLREEGLTVYGFGERKTPDAFVQACDKFVYTELLRGEAEPAAPKAPRTPGAAGASADAPTKSRSRSRTKPARDAVAEAAPVAAPSPAAVPFALIRQAIEDSADHGGWALLSPVGNYLTQVRPDFDPRLYGQRKLSDLLRAHPDRFEVDERDGGNGHRVLAVRVRRDARS